MKKLIKENLEKNGGRLDFPFIKSLADKGEVIHKQLTDNMRVCVIKLESGHEVIGVAQVLDAKNDIEAIGQEVAYDNAVNEIWKVAGNIAKLIQYEEGK